MPKQLFDLTTEREICDYYWTRLPSGYYPGYREVAAQYGCSPAHVRDLLKKHHRNRRTQAETRESRPCKPTNQPTGPAPLCACGCGEPAPWISKESKWQKYAIGHYSGMQRKLVQPAYDTQRHSADEPKRSKRAPSAHLSEILTVDTLTSLYVDQSHTIGEIAEILDVGEKSVSVAFKQLGIPLRTLSESLIQRGSVSREKNPAWKGGVAEWEYAPDWKRICKDIKDRDKWTCQDCGERRTRWGVHLHVHHIDGNKLNNDSANLTSLCAKCHRKAHGAR